MRLVAHGVAVASGRGVETLALDLLPWYGANVNLFVRQG
jgi:hypothetical protein